MEEVKEINAESEIVSVESEINENSQARRYLMTINNPEISDEEMCDYIEHLEHFKYCAFQREKGHECETEHLQIFLIFTVGKRFSTIKKLFPKAHIEKANGNNVQCRDYCTKSDTRVSGPYELGVFAEERARTDITNLLEMVKSGASNYEIMKSYPNQYIKYIDKIERIRQEMLYNDRSNSVKENLVVVYIYGASGVGKSYSLFNHYGNKACYIKQYEKNVFDAYKNQDIMVFDEFRSQLDFSEFLSFIDIYPIELNRRYSNMFGNYNVVFILTNWSPLSQYGYQRSNDYKSWQGFERRLHFILNFESRDKIILEKASKPLDELKNVLPSNMWKILDTKFYGTSAEEVRKQMKMFDPVECDEDDLPF